MKVVGELPRGYKRVTIDLSESEYNDFRAKSMLTGEGTISAAIRVELEMDERPYGLKSAKAREILGETDADKGEFIG